MKFSKISGLPYMLLPVHSFQFSVMCSGIVGTGVMRPAGLLGSENAGTIYVECYVIIVLWDVT